MIYLIVPAYNEAQNLPDLLVALTRSSATACRYRSG